MNYIRGRRTCAPIENFYTILFPWLTRQKVFSLCAVTFLHSLPIHPVKIYTRYVLTDKLWYGSIFFIDKIYFNFLYNLFKLDNKINDHVIL